MVRFLIGPKLKDELMYKHRLDFAVELVLDSTRISVFLPVDVRTNVTNVSISRHPKLERVLYLLFETWSFKLEAIMTIV